MTVQSGMSYYDFDAKLPWQSNSCQPINLMTSDHDGWL